MIFADRAAAGRQLAEQLAPFGAEHPLVLALPRGGVPVALPVAQRLGAPLDVLIVRKLGAPGNPEYAIGALAEGGAPWIRQDAVAELGVSPAVLARIVEGQRREIERRQAQYRGGRPPPAVRGRTVIVVDDGLATGATMMAAVQALKQMGALRVIVGVPAAAASSAQRLRRSVAAVVALVETEAFYAVGQWYEDFHQVEDGEVVRLLAQAAAAPPAPQTVEIAEGALRLPGLLLAPPEPRMWVIFAHGSGSSRLSPRNLRVAQALAAGGFGTLLFDLLTPAEAEDRRHVFDIALLSQRLLLATRWLSARLDDPALPFAYFGASTGAAAALRAAAAPAPGPRARNPLCAVVSRGGRPDLALEALSAVAVPTLLIVGGADEEVLALNRQAARRLRQVEVAVVPGAGHLFEEPGALDRVIHLAREWITRHAQAAPPLRVRQGA
jgi:predicted phosphoribosyltransferase/predicted alpha/beta-hydrolase family hydrolase